MKKYIIYTLCSTLALGAWAAGKTDIGSRARLRARKMPVEIVKSVSGDIKIAERLMTRSAEDETIRAFITVNAGTRAEQLEEAGATVHSMRRNIALCEFPQSALSELEALDCIVSIKTESAASQKMDKVRPAIGIDKIHSGEGLPQAYTGKGVIAGIVDGGFDPNHINFMDEDGENRIKQLTVYRYGQDMTGQQRVEEAKVSGERLKTIETDDVESFHATHTTGIMAGSYRGKLRTGHAVDFVTGTTKEVENPYYGIAYEADIVAGGAEGGQLSDYFIALGCESILDYAYEHNQPVALNISLGSNIGPHDGSSSICRYLDWLAEDDQVNAIVCVAAGNEGDQPIVLTKKMTAGENQLKSFITPMYPKISDGTTIYNNPRTGLIYIYSDSAEPFELQAQIFNKSRKKATAIFPLPEAQDGTMSYQYWVSSAAWQQADDDKIDPQLAKYFEGYIGLAADIDPDSGRYYSVIDFTCWDSASSNGNGNYIIGFQITGKDGQRIDVYGDGNMTYFSGEDMPGYSDGIFNGTINDIACGKNTIIVGSYNTRNYWGSLDGNVYGYWDALPENDMSAFTSFGTLVDGRELPHICAPGAAIISSSNKYYLEAVNAGDESVQARVAKNGRMHDFQQGVGTSMATPVVTGTIALWLEANPNLTAAEARDIMMRTALRDEAVEQTGDPIQWGAGKLDAYEGLKEVIRNSSVSEIAARGENGIHVRRSGTHGYDILVPGAEKVDAKVYNISGLCVMSASASGNEISLDTSSLIPGIYVAKINNTTIKLSIN